MRSIEYPAGLILEAIEENLCKHSGMTDVGDACNQHPITGKKPPKRSEHRPRIAQVLEHISTQDAIEVSIGIIELHLFNVADMDAVEMLGSLCCCEFDELNANGFLYAE